MRPILILFLLLELSLLSAQKNSTYGGVFTPKGDFKAILVPVYFSDGCSTNPNFKNEAESLRDWNMKDGRILPDVIDPKTGRTTDWMFNETEDFQKYLSQDGFNASKLFYWQSGGQFRFMVDVFRDSMGQPLAIEIDPKGGRGWSDMNKKAFAKMKEVVPDFDWSPYDQRKNGPRYQFDNSINPQPDSVVDYIIFAYRYSPRWKQHPEKGMPRWTGSGGGFASPAGIQLMEYNGYKFSEGFTMTWGSGVFVHELAHTLFNAPHLWGANSTVGQYFYQPSIGWGATATVDIFKMFNAWEAWYMGYLPNLVSINENLKEEQTYILQDFFTEQDALRIEIPFSGGQYLWLENHAKIHPFDEHEWAGWKIGNDSIAATPSGVYAYVESIVASQDKIIQPLSPACNGLRPLHAAGNYDYSYIDEKPTKNAWNNKIYRFRRELENPLAGTNPYFFFRADFNKDRKIGFDTNFNGTRNEGMPIICEEVEPDRYENLYQNFGVWNDEKAPNHYRPGAFQAGDQLDMSSNPMIHNTPTYNAQKKKLHPIYISGLSIKFEALKNSHKVLVKVKYGETQLYKNSRWAGNLILPNITRDEKADLWIAKRKKLFLVKSGTNNRHLPNDKGDFINPSYLKIKHDASMQLSKKAKLTIEEGATLELEKGAELKLAKKAKIVIKKGAKLILNGNSITKEKNARLIVEGEIIP
jgi:hypothetical protein